MDDAHSKAYEEALKSGKELRQTADKSIFVLDDVIHFNDGPSPSQQS